MPLPAFIDIHTHHASHSANVLAVVNRYDTFEKATNTQQHSFGLHPWYLSDMERQFTLLEKHAHNDDVIAIGECGLDKLCDTNFALQQRAFDLQINLANTVKKPLVIHCVHAYNECIAMLKKAEVPVIFHGFNKRQNIADMVLKEGYLCSFGKSLLDKNIPSAAVLANMAANNFFLETDDGEISIKAIYNAAAALRNCTLQQLQDQIHQNFKKVFNQ